MAKMEQILRIEPAVELTFVGPFDQQVSSVMHLTNPTDKKICFKIKTTAPKRYCVKPNSGVIDPDDTVKISVSLQPFEFDPQEKNKHKFMVQSMYAPEGEINQDVLWKEADGSKLMDSKLKCVFVVPESYATPNGNFKGNPPPLAPATSADHLSAEAYKSLRNNNEDHLATNKGETKGLISLGDTVGDGDSNLRKSVEEIKKMQEEVSALRQENIQLREEALRQQRLATNRMESDAGSPSSPAPLDGFKVSATNPDQTALTNTYIYMALFVLILGIIIGKWVF